MIIKGKKEELAKVKQLVKFIHIYFIEGFNNYCVPSNIRKAILLLKIILTVIITYYEYFRKFQFTSASTVIFTSAVVFTSSGVITCFHHHYQE